MRLDENRLKIRRNWIDMGHCSYPGIEKWACEIHSSTGSAWNFELLQQDAIIDRHSRTDCIDTENRLCHQPHNMRQWNTLIESSWDWEFLFRWAFFAKKKPVMAKRKRFFFFTVFIDNSAQQQHGLNVRSILQDPSKSRLQKSPSAWQQHLSDTFWELIIRATKRLFFAESERLCDFDHEFLEKRHKRSINKSEFDLLLDIFWAWQEKILIQISVRAGKLIHIEVGILRHKMVVWFGDSNFDA